MGYDYPDIIKAWEDDYNSMSNAMIFGAKPSFTQLVDMMRKLESLFHSAANG